MGEKEVFDQLKFRGEQIIVFENGDSIKVSGFACDFNENEVNIYACSNRSNPILSQLIDKVILNDPATIVFWQDGTKTIVKCQNGDKFDPEKGIAMAFMKRQYGNKGHYMDEIKKHIPKEKEDPKSKK